MIERQRKAFALSIQDSVDGTRLSVPRFAPARVRTVKLAWEDIMVDATHYRTMAAEHHRLAGICRSPESREQFLRLEKELLALADNEECLRSGRVQQRASHSQLVK
jgi:hypothetical protein